LKEMVINRKYRLSIFKLILLTTLSMQSLPGSCDVYFVTYATKDGRTGHSGLAVDNYDIYVRDIASGSAVIHNYDTVKKGTLTYFDFWPEKDHFSIRNVGKDTRARYNKLPAASYDKEITLGYLINYGVPHIKNFPCDGILRLETDPYEDFKLIHFMDSLIAINKPFNVRKYNCSDFILSGACYITDRKIRAKEFIPFSFSTTPNRLFKKLRALTETDVIVDPGKKVNGLFFKERVVDMLLSGMMAKRRIITGNTHNNL